MTDDQRDRLNRRLVEAIEKMAVRLESIAVSASVCSGVLEPIEPEPVPGVAIGEKSITITPDPPGLKPGLSPAQDYAIRFIRDHWADLKGLFGKPTQRQVADGLQELLVGVVTSSDVRELIDGLALPYVLKEWWHAINRTRGVTVKLTKGEGHSAGVPWIHAPENEVIPALQKHLNGLRDAADRDKKPRPQIYIDYIEGLYDLHKAQKDA